MPNKNSKISRLTIMDTISNDVWEFDSSDLKSHEIMLVTHSGHGDYRLKLPSRFIDDIVFKDKYLEVVASKQNQNIIFSGIIMHKIIENSSNTVFLVKE
jgi:hypothetical protein